MSEFKGTKGKWFIDYLGNEPIGVATDLQVSGNVICVSPEDFIPASLENWKANALLISKAPEMLFELNETLKDLLVLQGNVLESAKIDKKWDGMYELIQTWIDRKKQLIKEATEL